MLYSINYAHYIHSLTALGIETAITTPARSVRGSYSCKVCILCIMS